MSSSEIISGNNRILHISIILTGLAAILLFFIEPLLAGIPAVICGTLILISYLSHDAARHAHPILLAHLSENHREIILENAGTIAAEKIQINAVGIDEIWNIETIEPDTTAKQSLPAMVTLLTLEVTYQIGEGERKSKVFTVGSPEAEQDPFRPAFPLFGWKGKE